MSRCPRVQSLVGACFYSIILPASLAFSSLSYGCLSYSLLRLKHSFEMLCVRLYLSRCLSCSHDTRLTQPPPLSHTSGFNGAIRATHELAAWPLHALPFCALANTDSPTNSNTLRDARTRTHRDTPINKEDRQRENRKEKKRDSCHEKFARDVSLALMRAEQQRTVKRVAVIEQREKEKEVCSNSVMVVCVCHTHMCVCVCVGLCVCVRV